jgi:hypothetical protein
MTNHHIFRLLFRYPQLSKMTNPIPPLWWAPLIKLLPDFFRWTTDYCSKKSEARDKILTELTQLERFISLSEIQKSDCRGQVVKIIDHIEIWFRNTPALLRGRREEFIFRKLSEILERVKVILDSNNDQGWEETARRIKCYLLCCNLLKSRYDCIHHGRPGVTSNELQESHPDIDNKLSARDPHFLYSLAAFLPLTILIAFSPLGRSFGFEDLQDRYSVYWKKNSRSEDMQETSSSRTETSCPPVDKQNRFADELGHRIIGSVNDEGFKEIFSDRDLENMTRSINRFMGDSTPSNSITRQSGTRPQTADEYLGFIKDYQRSNVNGSTNTELSNKLERIKPMLYVLANNEKTTGMSPTHIVHIAVAIPFEEKQSDGPSPWGLGLLRGIDMAQRSIHDQKSNVQIKAMIVNDFFPYSHGNASQKPIQLSHFLATSSHDNKQFTGLIGHQQSTVSNLTDDCYNFYKLPVLLSHIHDPTGHAYIQSLLPSSKEMARKIVYNIQNDVNHSVRGIVVFFDKNDASSVKFSQDLCIEFKHSSSPNVYECLQHDISKENFSTDLVNNSKLVNNQWFVAINPYIRTGGRTSNMDKVIIIINEYANSVNSGSIYLGPDFVDETLVNDMNKTLGSKTITLWRFSPWDWRASTTTASSFDQFYKEYGTQYDKRLNWTSVNAINSLLFFHLLVEDSLDMPLSSNRIIPTKTLREVLAKRMSTAKFSKFKVFLPEPISFFSEGRKLMLRGNQVCKVHWEPIGPSDSTKQGSRNPPECF